MHLGQTEQMLTTDDLFREYYFSKPGYVGGTTQFHMLCDAYITRGSRILEIGPGPSNSTSSHLAELGTLVGLDVSNEIHSNSALSEIHVYDGLQFPFEDKSFDACVSDYVIEHIPRPELHFKEVARILRPGGSYCFRTPNLWHYVTLFSKVSPHTVHIYLSSRLRSLESAAHDPYPTVYLSNTPRAVRKLCAKARMDVHVLQLVEKEPSYGRAHVLLFYPMMCYERIVNSSDVLAGIRVNIFAVVRKPFSVEWNENRRRTDER